MFKLFKTAVVVDSVEKAIKFYVEKLLFTIVDLRLEKEGGLHPVYAELRKGKCRLVLRTPTIDELAEFSLVRRCNGRAVAIVVELKKNIEKYFQACKKKDLNIVSNLKQTDYGYMMFQLKDPFGVKIMVTQEMPEAKDLYRHTGHYLGMEFGEQAFSIGQDADVPEKMVDYLKSAGLSRRAAKKYIKAWAKKSFNLKIKDEDDEDED